MAPNRQQNLRFAFGDDGFTAMPRELGEGEPAWMATLRLSSYGGAAGAPNNVGAVSWATATNTARAQGNGITITYSNQKAGMRQNFLITQWPLGRGPLRLDFAVERRA